MIQKRSSLPEYTSWVLASWFWVNGCGGDGSLGGCLSFELVEQNILGKDWSWLHHLGEQVVPKLFLAFYNDHYRLAKGRAISLGLLA